MTQAYEHHFSSLQFAVIYDWGLWRDRVLASISISPVLLLVPEAVACAAAAAAAFLACPAGVFPFCGS